MANILTGSRILLSILLLFVPAFSPMFYICYLSAGFTDMVDGALARKTNTVSEFGSKLDTIADFIFVMVCLIKLLPLLSIPVWLWIWIAVIAAIKIINVVLGFVIYGKYIVEHTMMNKITGIMLFALPIAIPIIELKYCGLTVCTAAMIAAVWEGYYIVTGRVVL